MRQLKIRPQITNRKESSSLEKYISDVAKYNTIDVNEEVELFKELQRLNPDKKAIKDLDEETKIKFLEIRDKISNANMRFVVSVAKQYQQFDIPLTDLISE